MQQSIIGPCQVCKGHCAEDSLAGSSATCSEQRVVFPPCLHEEVKLLLFKQQAAPGSGSLRIAGAEVKAGTSAKITYVT